MSKNFFPEPLAWLIGLVFAGILALPLALAENGLTFISLWLAKNSRASAVRPLAAENKIAFRTTAPLQDPAWSSIIREGRSTSAGEVVALLSPTPRLLDDLRRRVRPQLAFSSAAGEFEDLIESTARAHHVSPLLVKSVIQAESRFNPSAVSHKGAVGLMQVMPATGRGEGVDNLLDPKLNLEAGVRHLKKLLKSFNDDEYLAIAAYNCGQEAMKKFNNLPPFQETRDYVNRVMSYYSQHLES